jgi:type IV pilus assembly protein PilB
MSMSDANLIESRRDLADILLDARLVTPAQVQVARLAAQNGQSVVDVLVAQKSISARDAAMALSLQLNLPLIDLKRHTVQPHALQLVPEEIARRHLLVPLDVIDGELIVVTTNPLDMQAMEDVSLRAGMRVRPAVGVRDDIAEALAMYYRSRREIERQIDQIAPEPAPALQAPRLTAQVIAENPVARVVELILNQAIRDRASDVHVMPDADALHVRYRIDGILHDALQAPLTIHGPLVSRIKILADMNIAERRRPQDGQFTFEGERGPVDVRVATAETARGEMAV